jgi:hypothetical protein
MTPDSSSGGANSPTTNPAMAPAVVPPPISPPPCSFTSTRPEASRERTTAATTPSSMSLMVLKSDAADPESLYDDTNKV